MSKLFRWKEPNKRLPVRIAHEAFKKLHMGEEISDEELKALFDSFYVHPVKKEDGTRKNYIKPEKLYEVKKEFKNSEFHKVLIPSIELEMLAYFSKKPEMLYELSPRKFEEVIASIFQNNGFEVELTPKTHDGGIDILAIEKKPITGKSLYIVECKRYKPSNKVGIGIVQRMYGLVESYQANKGIIATTSSFSKDAKIFAEASKYRLSLSDYNVIKQWLNAFNESPNR